MIFTKSDIYNLLTFPTFLKPEGSGVGVVVVVVVVGSRVVVDPVSDSKPVSVPASDPVKFSWPKRTLNLIHHTAIHLRSDICTFVKGKVFVKVD